MKRTTSRSTDVDLVPLFEEFHESVIRLAHLERCSDAAHKTREYMMPVQLESDELASIYRQIKDICELLDAQKSLARKQYVELKDNFLKAVRTSGEKEK